MIELSAILALLIMLLLGIPVFVALGAVASSLLLIEGMTLAGLAQVVLDHLNSITLTAFPFFVVAAVFLQRGGLATALIEMAQAWLGNIRGGLAYVCVAAGTSFSALSGSSVATSMAMGTVLAPEMKQRDYPRPFTLGLIGTAGTLGILVPPSIALILFGVLANESIPKLFLAGVVPALLQALLLVVAVFIVGKVKGLPYGQRVSMRAKVIASSRALPALGIIVMLFGGIYSGVVTTTEAAALTVVLSIIASVYVYKGCRFSDVLPFMTDGLTSAARIIFIVSSALLLSHWLVVTRIPDDLVNNLMSRGVEPWQFLLIVNLFLIVLGFLLEGIAILLIATPLITPLLDPMGIDPLHFAVILVVNIELALLSPPLGLNLFVLANVGKCSSAEVLRGIWPFWGLMLLLLALVSFIPSFSTWLPNMVYPK